MRKLLKWTNKKQIILIFTVLHLKKKIMKNTCRYHYQNLHDRIYSFGSFFALKTPRIKILKNEKICWRYHHFTHVHQKSQSYDVQFLRYGVRLTKMFCHFERFFALLPPPPPNDPEYQNFEKNAWRYYPFIHTCVP